MESLPSLHSDRKLLYHTSEHLLSSRKSQKDRIVSGPSVQKISWAFRARPGGVTVGSLAMKVPVTGWSWQKSAHITKFTPPNTRVSPFFRVLYVPCARTAPLTIYSKVPKSSAEIILTSSIDDTQGLAFHGLLVSVTTSITIVVSDWNTGPVVYGISIDCCRHSILESQTDELNTVFPT